MPHFKVIYKYVTFLTFQSDMQIWKVTSQTNSTFNCFSVFKYKLMASIKNKKIYCLYMDV